MNILLLKAILFYLTATLVAAHLPRSARLIHRLVKRKMPELFLRKPIQAQIMMYLAISAGLTLVASHGLICVIEGTIHLDEYIHTTQVV